MISSISLRRVLAGLAGAVVVASASFGATSGSAPALRNDLLVRHDTVSVNWAGYIVAGASFNHVTATWTQPSVACAGSRPLDASSFWIGLGGASYTSPGLEQAGTSADCVQGHAHHYAWYEVLPAPATNLSFEVAPGDSIAVDVDVTNGVTTFELRNLTTGETFSRTVPVRFPATDSAEWIAEAPSVCRNANDCRTLPLARFVPILFTSASATANAHTGSIADGGWSAEAVRLSSRSGPVSAAPSVLSQDGSSFSVAAHGPRVRLLLPGMRPLPLPAAPAAG